MMIVQVIPLNTTSFNHSFSYFSYKTIKIGTLVSIPLRNKQIYGIVVSNINLEDEKQALRKQKFKIKKISEVHDINFFSDPYTKTLRSMEKYYFTKPGLLINATYPTRLIKNKDFSPQKQYTQYPDKSYTQHIIQDNYNNRIKIYKKLITENIKKGQSIQIFCPTKKDTQKIFSDLKNLSSENIYILNGSIATKKIKSIYTKIELTPSVIISTPQFLDIPLYKKNTFIIESDSSEYYYRHITPKIDLRTIIEEYAKHSKIKLFFSDIILRPLRIDKHEEKLRQNIFTKNKISYSYINKEQKSKKTDQDRIKEITKKEGFAVFSSEIKTAIKQSISREETIFCYVQKKSLAPTIICYDCGKIVIDQSTNTPYALQIDKNSSSKKEYFFLNKKTNQKLPAFDLCQFCHSWKLKPLGVGTTTIAQVLKKHFPQTNISIIDSFHTKTKKQILEQCKTSKEKTSKIIIGTQLAIPYLKNIDSSYIISIDSLLMQMSYTTDMRALYLLSTIADQTKKNIYIQTRNKHPLLSQLHAFNYHSFVKEQKEESRAKHLPPFGTIMKITYTCDTDQIQTTQKMLNELFKENNPNIRTDLSHKKNKKNIYIILHLSKKQWSTNTQDPSLIRSLEKIASFISIEINPEIL